MTIKRFLFLRNDDVKSLDKQFLAFFNLFLKMKVPVVYGVIPGEAGKEVFVFLRRMKKAYPGLIDIVQHGWKHIDYGVDKNHPKGEFGLGRDYQAQKRDIFLGWIKMRRELGDFFTPAFIPPYHSYDFTTLKIMNEAAALQKFSAFSAKKKTFPKHKNFVDLPADVLFEAGKDPDSYPSQIIKKLALRFQKQPLTGMLLHHAEYSSRDLKIIEQVLHKLKSGNIIRMILFSEILKPCKRGRLNVTLAITNRCNLKCKICNIWKEKPERDLAFVKLKLFLTNLLKHYKVASISLTGGELFLNKDIDKIFDFLCLLRTRNEISSIGIFSNGFANDTILDFLKRHKTKMDNCELGLSCDGLEKTHDYLRGKKGSWQSIMKLVGIITEQYRDIKLSIKFTISPGNIKDILAVYRYCRNRNIRFYPKFAESDSPYYYHKGHRIPEQRLNFSHQESGDLIHILRFIIKNELKSKSRIMDPNIPKILLNHLALGMKTQKTCYTPLHNIFITASGDIHTCLYREPLANIHSPQWLQKLNNKKFFDQSDDSLNGRCPGCLAYHGYLKTVNM